MLGLIRLRRGRRPFLLLYSRYGSDLCHTAPRNHIPHAISACEMVIGSLEFGFADGDGLVAVAEFHEVMVRTTAEDDQADQERQGQLAFDFVRTHAGVFFVHGSRCYTVTVALAMFSAATDSSLSDLRRSSLARQFQCETGTSPWTFTTDGERAPQRLGGERPAVQAKTVAMFPRGEAVIENPRQVL